MLVVSSASHPASEVNGDDRVSVRAKAISIGVGIALVVAVIAAFALVRIGSASPEVMLASAISNIKDVSSMAFTMEMDMEMDGVSTPMSMDGVMAYPADSSFTMAMELLGQTVSYDQITVDGVAYVKYPLVPTWGYMDLDVTTASPGQSASPTSYLAYLEAFLSVEDLGSEEVAGVECRHLRLEIEEAAILDTLLEQTAEAGGDFTLDPDTEIALRNLYESSIVDVDIWVGVDDRLPYRQSIDMQMGESVDYTVHAVMEFSDFDEPVEIVAPEGAMPIDQLLRSMTPRT